MKTYPFKPAQAFHLAGLTQIVLLFLMLPLTTVCFGAPQTNTIPWFDTFENFTNYAPLINGTNGWYSSPPSVYDTNMPAQTSIVQNVVAHSGSMAAKIAIGDTLSNSFVGQPARNVKLEMYVRPQLMTSSVFPVLSSNFAAQFFISTNGYFVVGNGTTWNVASNMPNGPSLNVTNISDATNFVRVQVHLQYNTHTWDLKAWTNSDGVTEVLVASTNYLRFANNMNCFSSFTVYNGTTNSYLDDITITRFEGPIKINGVSFDTIKRMNNALPDGKVNGVNAQ